MTQSCKLHPFSEQVIEFCITGETHSETIMGVATTKSATAKYIRFRLTFVGSGHSSSSSVITAGPRGSSNGITLIKDWTTSNQPSSVNHKTEVTLRINTAILKCSKYIHKRKLKNLQNYPVSLKTPQKTPPQQKNQNYKPQRKHRTSLLFTSMS